jgi:hypothetical protein
MPATDPIELNVDFRPPGSWFHRLMILVRYLITTIESHIIDYARRSRSVNRSNERLEMAHLTSKPWLNDCRPKGRRISQKLDFLHEASCGCLRALSTIVLMEQHASTSPSEGPYEPTRQIRESATETQEIVKIHHFKYRLPPAPPSIRTINHQDRWPSGYGASFRMIQQCIVSYC